jgi:nicotinamidase/pyrazinamidase
MPTVFFDIDTQIDFLFPAGALYVPGAEKLIPALRRLNRHAADHGITVISTTDAHSENDQEFRTWPPHCIVETFGQRKAADTVLEKQVVITNRPVEISISGAQQIVLQKQALDLFTNVNLESLLRSLNAGEYVVYGVVTEYCVKCAALGLLRTGRQVSLVTDAVETLHARDSEAFVAEFVRGGGRLTTVSEVCAQ